MFSDEDRLRLQQLRLLEWVEEHRPTEPDGETDPDEDTEPAELPLTTRSSPDEWSLVGDIELHAWQLAAADAWFAAGRRGTIKVVTGAGKTITALAIAERLQRDDPDLRVVVVAPTIVLMQQWFSLLERSNLPRASLGRLGGGYKDDLAGERRILVTVLASARKELPKIVRDAGVGEHLLLVVDESHRAGSPEMSMVLNTERAYSLGLSATPERGGGEGADQGESDLLWEALGGIVYEMTFAEAIREGILPPFELDHYGVPLNAREAQRYQALTRSINDTRRELTSSSTMARKAGGGEGLLTWARRVASRPSGNLSALAARYVNDTTRRKQLLYKAESRTAATLSLVREALAERGEARVILFHESIDEVVRLYERMSRDEMPAVMEHSELPSDLREASLELFRQGTAQVVVSARSLIEGFNVPEADLGIIVASSSSSRQRIQSIGRVLRKHRDAAGEEKASRICVLYMRDTVDEAIYEKQDWARLIGLDRNRYFHWDPPDEPTEQEAAPRAAVPTEAQIDLSALAVGDAYPGRYQGAEYSTDRLGNVIDAEGSVALNPQDVPATIEKLRGSPGRFRVTSRESGILVRVPVAGTHRDEAGSTSHARLVPDPAGEQLRVDGSEEWVTLFGGLLAEPFAFPTARSANGDVDVSTLSPGDMYPGPIEPASEYRFRQRGGGVIARRIRGGELFAGGPGAAALVDVLRDRSKSDKPVSRFYLNELGHAFWREGGAARFIGAIDGPLEFPEGPK